MLGRILENLCSKRERQGLVNIHLLLDRSNINYEKIFRFLKLLIPGNSGRFCAFFML